jgi:hypothetical protein
MTENPTRGENFDDLLFSCRVDTFSEIDALNAVQRLNYLVDGLIVNIIANHHPSGSGFDACYPTNQDSDDSDALGKFLKSHRLTDVDARDFVAEFLLRNLVFSLLHTHYFDGPFFWGVESESLRTHLERVMTELFATGGVFLFLFFLLLFVYTRILLGNYNDCAIYRWRSMTTEAVFNMNHDVESIFNAQLTTSILEFENSLDSVFPDSPTFASRSFIGHSEHLQLIEIVKEARVLSFKLQNGVVSCRLSVTVAQAPKDRGDIHGTYSFGLEKVSGTERTHMLRAGDITDEKVRSFLENT